MALFELAFVVWTQDGVRLDRPVVQRVREMFVLSTLAAVAWMVDCSVRVFCPAAQLAGFESAF